MITAKTLEQQTEAEALATKNQLQASYEENDLGETLIAKSLQLDVWSVCGIPIGRSDEFDNASPEDKTKFCIISCLAQDLKYKDVTYIEAWELEYAKIYP